MKTIQFAPKFPDPNRKRLWRAAMRRYLGARPWFRPFSQRNRKAHRSKMWMEIAISILPAALDALNAGHRQPLVTKALHEQVDKFLHLCFGVTPYESYIALAEKLNALAPISGPKKTMFINSGAEGVENAVKIARAYTKRPAVISFEDAFHGRTLLTMSLTSKINPYKAGFAPFATEIYRIPYAYCYRCSYSMTYPSCKIFCARHLEDTFRRVVEANSVAAIIAETVLGEGGFVAPPKEFFSVLSEICNKYGIVLIADEVQCGVGRTGKFFAIEHYGVEPDLITTAKSFGGGLPLGGVTGRAEIMDAAIPGGLGSTFAGNPQRVLQPLLPSKPSKRTACWRVPRRSASGLRNARRAGRKNGHSSVMFALSAECARLNLSAIAKPTSPPVRKPRSWHSSPTSMASSPLRREL